MSNLRERIPVSILTGFLGAGKSTLLNRILKDPDMREAAVIINEFGDVGIDHLLVESSGDAIIELSDGCLCCTVRGELVDTLANLMDAVQTGRVKPVRRVVIETTGLADPAPVMQAIMGNPIIATNFELEGVVTVMDADDPASGTSATLVNGLYDPATKITDVGRWLRDEDAHAAHHHHNHAHD